MTQPELAHAELDDTPAPAAPGALVLRERMVTQLVEEGMLDEPAIEAAFRVVPREVFAPAGTPAELPYAVHEVVRTRFSDNGRTLSSLSAPFMLLCTGFDGTHGLRRD